MDLVLNTDNLYQSSTFEDHFQLLTQHDGDQAINQILPQDTAVESRNVCDLYLARKQAYDTFTDYHLQSDIENIKETISKEIIQMKNDVDKIKKYYRGILTNYIETSKKYKELKHLVNDISRVESGSLNLARKLQNNIAQESIVNQSEVLAQVYKEMKDTMEDNLKESAKEVKKYQAQIEEFSTIFSSIQTFCGFRVCPICLSDEIQYFTIPCAHTYCKSCSKRITSTCYICKGNVLTINPLFLH